MVATAKQMHVAIGQQVNIKMESLQVTCEVKDVKNSYGRVRLLVFPLCGSGEQWIEMSRVTSLTNLSHNNFAARLEETL